MKNICLKLAKDNKAFVVSIELLVISGMIVVGLLVGLTALRDAVVSELSDTVGSVQDLNQSMVFNGVTGPSAANAGAGFSDSPDVGDSINDPSGQADNGVFFNGLPANEQTKISIRRPNLSITSSSLNLTTATPHRTQN